MGLFELQEHVDHAGFTGLWLDDGDDVKFGVPNHARLNSLRSAMSLRNFLLRFGSKG